MAGQFAFCSFNKAGKLILYEGTIFKEPPNSSRKKQNFNGIRIPYYMGPVARKSVLGGLRTTKVQTSLRSAQSDQRLCYSLTGKNYIHACYEETGLSLAFSETPKTGFVASRPLCKEDQYLVNSLCTLMYGRHLVVMPGVMQQIIVL